MTIDEAIRHLYTYSSTNGSGQTTQDQHEEAKLMAIKALKAQQWVPCIETEDLPKHEVLCCDKYGEELIGWLSCEDDQWLCESDGEIMYDVVAWMEKPKPWKGENNAMD